jgi:hypothetical protein
MDSKTKHGLEKRIKTYTIIAWSMVGFFILYVILIMSSHTIFGKTFAGVLANVFGTTFDAPIILIVAISLLVTPLFLGLMFTMLSQAARQQLYSYRNAIRLYRTRKFGKQILELVQAGNIAKAIEMYKNFDLKFEKQLDDFVFGIILGACKYSDDEVLQKLSEYKINKIKECFSPDKIEL